MKTNLRNLISLLSFFVFCFIYTNSSSSVINSEQGNDYTFCYGRYSLTLFDGGKCIQIQYDLQGKAMKRISGEWEVYDSPVGIPGQTLKIKFEISSITYDYTLIKNGSLSVLIDNQGRRYELCNNTNSGNASNSFPDLSKSSEIVLPKASSHPEYIITKSDDGLYLVTNKETNTPIFYVANDNLYYSDQKNRLNFSDASSLIEGLKIGNKENWRLPTLFELEIIYGLKSQIIPSPTNSMYWTSTKSDKNPSSSVMGIIFRNGDIVQGVKRGSGRIMNTGFEQYGYTFAIRDINPKNNPKLKETIIVEMEGSKKIMIALNGMPNYKTDPQTLDILKKYILELNQNKFKDYDDWRIPTIQELRVLYKNIDVLEDVEYYNNDGYYNLLWSSTRSSQNKDEYFVKDFKNGEERNDYIGNPNGSGIFVWKASPLIIRDINSIDQSVVDNPSNINKSQYSSSIDKFLNSDNKTEDEVLSIADEMPQFPGGESALEGYISSNLKYPVIAQKNGIQGRVYVGYVINKDGSVSDVKILREVDPSLDKEAIRIINSLPKWKPGKQNGVPVRVSNNSTVIFNLY